MEFLREWKDRNLFESWLTAEPIDVLDGIDVDAAWGRPLTTASFAYGSSREERSHLFNQAEGNLWRKGEVIQHIQLTVIDEQGAPCGFSEACFLQLPDTEEKLCRICYDGEDEGELLFGCACRGSMKYIHSECLRAQEAAKSFSEAATNICGLCHQSLVGSAGRKMAEVKRERIASDHSSNTGENVTARISMATLLWQQGNNSEAAQMFRKAIRDLEAADDDAVFLNLCSAQHNLGLVYLAQEKLVEASKCIRAAKEGFTKKLGNEHQLVLKARHNEALILQTKSEFQRAIQLYIPLLEDRERILGAENMDTLKTALNLGLCLFIVQRYEEAVTNQKSTLQRLQRVAGRQHPNTLSCMQNLSLAVSKLDPQSEEALQHAREAADGRLLVQGPDHQDTFDGWRDLATVLMAAGKHEAALESMRRALSGQQRVFGFKAHRTQQFMDSLCRMLDEHGDAKASEELRREHGSKTVTSAQAAPAPMDRGPIVVFVLNIYVLPQYRRRKVGQAVMEHWKQLAREASAESVQALARPGSEALRFFCSGCGFRHVCERMVNGSIVPRCHLNYNL